MFFIRNTDKNNILNKYTGFVKTIHNRCTCSKQARMRSLPTYVNFGLRRSSTLETLTQVGNYIVPTTQRTNCISITTITSYRCMWKIIDYFENQTKYINTLSVNANMQWCMHLPWGSVVVKALRYYMVSASIPSRHWGFFP